MSHLAGVSRRSCPQLPYRRGVRFAVLALLVSASPIAHAEVFRDRVHERAASDTAAPPLVSNKLYLNNCKPNGCPLQPGFDDSRTNHSSIAFAPTMMSAWPHSDALWDELVSCVRATFRPFQIDVVTDDPGAATNHFEVIVAGTFAQLNPELQGAGGVAPFIGCGGTDDNVISFVFAQQSDDLEYLCGAVAQEAAHVWGLDHELNALDPMTYLDLGSLKRFQNADAKCGTVLNQPQPCSCGGTTQNSYEYLEQMFGATDLPPSNVAITSPGNGAWVRPGFPVHVMIDSVLGGTRATLAIDGAEVASISPGPFAFNAPLTISAGPHEVTTTGIDGGNRSVTASITVRVTAACSATAACADGTYCIGGYCVPGADVDGGLGAECLANEACITRACASGNGEQLCVAPCDRGRACPDGFYCTGPDDAPVCWPDRGAGCEVAPGHEPPIAILLGLGFAAIVLRRRRFRPRG